MKREILFRGKQVKDRKWVEGLLTKDVKGHFRIHYDPAYFSVVVDPETVGQFTGLLDKNGIKIFEGDIIDGESYLYKHQLKPNGEQFHFRGVVEFETQCDVGLCYVLTDKNGSWNLNQTVHRNQIDFCTGIIIGNIHDNPELLNK